MINIIIASPGPLGLLVREAAHSCLATIGRSVETVDVDAIQWVADHGPRLGLSKLEIVAERAIATSADVLLAAVGSPDSSYGQAAIAAKRPFLIVVEEPRTLVSDAIRDGRDPVSAIREMMGYYAGALALINSEYAVPVSKNLALADPGEFALRIQRALAITLDAVQAATLERVILANPTYAALQASGAAEARQPELDSGAHMAVEAALSGYALRGGRLQIDKLIATRALFYSAEPMGEAAPRAIDVTGRARLLFFGPYLLIPAGRWNLRLVLAFSAELAGSPFVLDVVANSRHGLKELGQAVFQATEGRYVVQIAFTNVEPGGKLEFRLWSQASTFDGKVSIGYAELVAIDTESEAEPESIEWRSGQNG